ncbi:MAG: glycosyltransferase family protein [Candidatus Helarchaeales archaeon]
MKILIMGSLSVNLLANNIAMLRERGHEVEILNVNRSNKVNLPEELKKDLCYVNFYKARTREAIASSLGSAPVVKRKSLPDLNRLIIFFWNKIKFEPLRMPIRKLYESFAYRQNLRRFNLEGVNELLKNKDFDLVFSFWGANIISEIDILKKKYDIPIVHSIQSYPYGKSVVGDGTRGDRLHESFFRKLDGRIHASPYMLRYFKTKFNLGGRGKDLIMMEYFKKSYFSKRRQEKLSEADGEPHLVFIGRTDFELRDWDDIREQAREITSNEIHFHLARSTQKFHESRYLHFFEPYPTEALYNGTFAEDLTRYDACIVLYNIKKRYDRFWNSLPLRFLSAIPAGIPIIVPKGYFGACEYVLKKHGIGFTYDDVKDLKRKLLDVEFMKKQQENTLKNHQTLTFENHVHELEAFFEEVIQDHESQKG